jgi:hypothetical protein
LDARICGAASAAQFEPVAWWYAREEIGRGLRERYGPADRRRIRSADAPRISSAIVAIGTDRWGILAILVMMGVRQQPMSAFKSKADIGFSEVHVWF